VQRSYRVGETTFGFRSTSNPFADWLDHVLRKHRVREETAPLFSVVVGGGKEGGQLQGKGFHILYRRTLQVIRTLDLPAVARLLFDEINSLEFEERDDAVYLEAMLLSADGVTALIPSMYLPALGRLGRKLNRAGLRLAPTRKVAVDPRSGRLVQPATVVEIPDDAMHKLEETFGLSGNGDRTSSDVPSQVDLVYAPGDPEKGGEPISRARALYNLGAFTINLPKVGSAGLEGLNLLLEGTPRYGLTGGDRELLGYLTSTLRP